MYAIVRTGGKQYRVEPGQWLLVERLRGDDGAEVELEPLLFVDGSTVVDGGDELRRVTVQARVVRQERGPKLRIVKFKPKRGYKRRTGHRQDLTRIEVTRIELGAERGDGQAHGAAGSPRPVGAEAASAPRAVPADPGSGPPAVAADNPSEVDSGA